MKTEKKAFIIKSLFKDHLKKVIKKEYKKEVNNMLGTVSYRCKNYNTIHSKDDIIKIELNYILDLEL